MTNNDVKQIRDAFARLSKGIKIIEFDKANTVRIDTDYKLFDGDLVVSFYAYMRASSKKIYLTDAGRAFKQMARSSENIQDAVVQAMLESYGLTLLPDNSILDQQDIPLHDRIANIIQVQIGIDAMARTWYCYANKVKTKKELSDG